MSRYIRPRIPGATVFFTVCLADRTSSLLVSHVDLLRHSVWLTRRERPFTIDAWVVLPDHLHCVWTLPEYDADYGTRWSIIKARFSRAMPFTPRRTSHCRRREHGLWQRRFWEHHLRTGDARLEAITYCWNNPVKHGLVDSPDAWPYSSWHRDHGPREGAP